MAAIIIFNEWLFWWLLDFFSVEIIANLFVRGVGQFQDRNLKVFLHGPIEEKR